MKLTRRMNEILIRNISNNEVHQAKVINQGF